MRQQKPFFFAVFCCLLLLAASGCNRQAALGPAFDVPSLLGKKFVDIEKTVGTPESADSLAPDTKRAVFRKPEGVMTVDYLARNGRVTAFTLAPADASVAVKEDDKAQLLTLGKLNEKDARYALDYIEDEAQVFRFKGVRVTPAPVQHNVALRISGASEMVSARYTAPTGAAGTTPGEPFLTMAPWDHQFTAPTGTTVGIEAGITPVPGAPVAVAEVTVQILVDGKIAQQKTVSAGTAQCSLELD
jgi:hypothetical protein